jgi:hypothetical protein
MVKKVDKLTIVKIAHCSIQEKQNVKEPIFRKLDEIRLK